ncbi:MAG TPA: hypothetical protein VGD67_15320 [Pseudonocardiaceae bacterium]
MYSTRLLPVAVPVTAGVSAFGSWTVAVVSIVAVLAMPLAVRTLRQARLRHRATEVDGP